MTGDPGQVAPRRPTAVAIHDDGDMKGWRGWGAHEDRTGGSDRHDFLFFSGDQLLNRRDMPIGGFLYLTFGTLLVVF